MTAQPLSVRRITASTVAVSYPGALTSNDRGPSASSSKYSCVHEAGAHVSAGTGSTVCPSWVTTAEASCASVSALRTSKLIAGPGTHLYVGQPQPTANNPSPANAAAK